LKKPKLYKNHN